jgi:hypothetical protein
MPRPKSELTDNSKHIGVRLTAGQFQEWKRLGGAMWLRKQLSKSLEKHHGQRSQALSK